MLNNSILLGRSSLQITILSIAITLTIGILDYITGREISFSIFYTIPIAVASWYGGKKMGIFLGFFSAISWFLADLVSGHPYSHKLIPVWNASVRLGFFIIISLLLSKIKTTLEIVREQADIDGLTGLLNGRAFRESTTQMFEFCRRIKRPVTLAYIDLDNFKQVNDNSGHSEGDHVLQVVADTLPGSVRKTDIIGRMGGDEFAVMLPDTNREQAITVIEKMHLTLSNKVGEHDWPIGFSIGVMTFAVPPKTAEEAITYADNLMYRVKKSGKNNFFFEDYQENL